MQILILFLVGIIISTLVLFVYFGNTVFWGVIFGTVASERIFILIFILTVGLLFALIGVIKKNRWKNKWLLISFLIGIIVGTFGLIVISTGIILMALSPEAPDSLRNFAINIIFCVGLLGGLIGFLVDRKLHLSRTKEKSE